MISRNELKYYNSLLQKKQRKNRNKFLVEGKKTILEGIHSKYNCEIILLTEKFLNDESGYVKKFKSAGVRIEPIKSADIKWVTDTKSPEGIAAVFSSELPAKKVDEINDPLVVYLENISDPGNVGTIIRNCDWFGVKTILISKESAELYNPKVIRASMGSIFHCDIYLDITIGELNDFRKRRYKFICSDLKGTSIFQHKRNNKIILFLSNESTGPSEELLSISDQSVTIPRQGQSESLNVASSSAVLLAELTKHNK